MGPQIKKNDTKRRSLTKAIVDEERSKDKRMKRKEAMNMVRFQMQQK